MLAYPIDEAEELLEQKLGAAKTSLANCEEDMDFLREQVTVSFPPRAVFCGIWIGVLSANGDGADYGSSCGEGV
jgi:hypothetical protein